MRLTLHAVAAEDRAPLHTGMRPTLRAAGRYDERFSATGLTPGDADDLVPMLVAFAHRPRDRAAIDAMLAERLGAPSEPGLWRAALPGGVRSRVAAGLRAFRAAAPGRGPDRVRGALRRPRGPDGSRRQDPLRGSRRTPSRRRRGRPAAPAADVGFGAAGPRRPRPGDPGAVPRARHPAQRRRARDRPRRRLRGGCAAAGGRRRPGNDVPCTRRRRMGGDRARGACAAIHTGRARPQVYGRFGHWWAKGLPSAQVRVVGG